MFVLNFKIIFIFCICELIVTECRETREAEHINNNHSCFKRFNLSDVVELSNPIFKFKEKNIVWLLDNNDTLTPIYNNNKLEQPDNYECFNSNNTCLGLKINNLNSKSLGQYIRKSESIDERTVTKTVYNVYGFKWPFNIYCKQNSSMQTKCNYDAETKTLLVYENIDFVIGCETIIYNSSELTTKLEIDYRYGDCSDQNKFDCKESYNKSKGINNIYENKINKECLSRFKRSDKIYKCVLRKQFYGDLNEDVFEFSVKLNVMYDIHKNETEFNSIQRNIIIPQDKQYELVCPFEGNPVNFIWTSKLLNENVSTILQNSSNKTLLIPSNTYSQGVYMFECHAFMSDYPNNSTNVFTKFDYTVTIAQKEYESEKSKALTIIVAIFGIIVAFIVAIFLLILCKGFFKSKQIKIEDDSVKLLEAVEI